MIVRAAVPADEDALVSLLYALADENNSFGDELDEDRIRHAIRLGTEARGGCHGVIDGDGEIAGSVGIVIDRWFYARRYMLTALWMFVRPAYRHLRCDQALIDWAKDHRNKVSAAVGYNITLVNSVISEKRLAAKLRLWERHSKSEMVGGIFLIRE